MVDYYNRCDLLIFETAEEYCQKKAIEKEKLREEIKAYKMEVEKKGRCQNCQYKNFNLRWVLNGEAYICYKCFIEQLDIMASIMVPPRNATQMGEYMEEWKWNSGEGNEWVTKLLA